MKWSVGEEGTSGREKMHVIFANMYFFSLLFFLLDATGVSGVRKTRDKLSPCTTIVDSVEHIGWEKKKKKVKDA